MATRALTEIDTKRLLAEAGIAVTMPELARSVDAGCGIAARVGFPVVAKIVSPDIVHKSEVGGVRVGLRSAVAVGAAFAEITAAVRAARPQARVDGISIQPMAPAGGIELIVGAKLDAQFGPVLMCGLGGVFVEVLGDVAFRLVPLAARDARDLLRELRGFPVLAGARGPAADVAGVERLLLAVSALLQQRPDIVELDLNPVLAYPDAVLAVDARALVEAAQ